MTYEQMVEAAAYLASNGDNPEYDRALSELIADTVGAVPGMPLDERAPQVLADIRGHQALDNLIAEDTVIA